MSTIVADQNIDARGMPCPGPLLSLIGAIRQAPVGHVVEVLSSDAGSRTDIPAWVTKAKHEMVDIVDENGFAHFVVRKAH